MVSFRHFTMVVGLSAFAMTASADLVCENGQCISDPSLTSDAPVVYRVPSSSAHASSAESPFAQAAGAPATSEVGGVTGTATTVSNAAATGTATTTDCVSPYPSLPLTSVQQTICEQGKARLIAAAQQKAKEAADQAQQNKPQQPQQPQQPQGGQPQGGQPQQGKGDDKGGDESDPCKKKLAEIVKQCSGMADQAADNCNPETDQGLNKAIQGYQNSQSGAGTSSFNSNNQTSGGCAIASQGMSNFAGSCSGGQTKNGEQTSGHEQCSAQCAKLAQKVMSTPECKQSKNDEDKKKAKKKLVSKKEACDALQQVSEGAKQNAGALGQCSGDAGKNAGGGAGGMGDMMKALAGLAQKAQQEQQRQDQQAQDIGAVDVCQDPAVQSQVRQICVCQKQNMDERTCSSMMTGSVAPIPTGVGRDPASVPTPTGSTGGDALPAGVTGP